MLIDQLTKTYLAGVIGIWLLVAAACSTIGNDHAALRPSPSPEGAAQTELNGLHNLQQRSLLSAIGIVEPTIDPEDQEFAKDLGFASAKEAVGAQLGSPLHIYSVPLDRLQTFQPGDDPNTILIDTHRAMFPITVNGQVRSSLTVTEQGNGWRTTQRGSPKLIRKIQELNPSGSSFLVSITPLRLRLLGNNQSGQLMLTSIEEHPRFGLKAGDQRPAQELFATLASAAKHVYESDQKIRERPSHGIRPAP